MKSSMNLAAIVTLAISAGLAGTGCMASSEEAIPSDDEAQAAPAQQADVGNEKTGEATEKCGFGGGFGWGGLGCGGFGLGGFGWGGLGCGGFGWGGFGGCFPFGVGLPFNGVGAILPFNGLGCLGGFPGGWW